jgi:hypothetical protein
MITLINSALLNGNVFMDVLPQITEEDFCPEICSGTYFWWNEGEGLQLYSIDPQHLCENSPWIYKRN